MNLKKQKVIFSAARIFYGGCFGCLVNGGGVSGHWQLCFGTFSEHRGQKSAYGDAVLKSAGPHSHIIHFYLEESIPRTKTETEPHPTLVFGELC